MDIENYNSEAYMVLIVAAAAMALILALVLMTRRQHVAGLLSLIIAAMLGLSAQDMVDWSAPPDDDYDHIAAQDDIDRRDRRIRNLERTLEEKDREITRLISIANQSRNSVDDSMDSLLQTHGEHLDDLLRLAIEADPGRSASVSAVQSDREYTARANQRRYRGVGDEIRQLARIIDRMSVEPEPIIEEPLDALGELRDRFAVGYATQGYEIRRMPDNELITGRSGDYYLITLKNASTGDRFRFGGGQYTLGGGNQAFRWALGVVGADILHRLEGEVRYDIFVRGSADRGAYNGRFESGYEYPVISYLRSAGEGRYTTQEEIRRIGAQVRNDDLPFLRAQFLKQGMANAYRRRAPTVLESHVTQRSNASDRYAELILFVDW